MVSEAEPSRSAQIIMWYAYILKCADSSYYVGHTDDLDQRIKIHSSGRGPTWTTSRLPVKLIYQEKHDNQIKAIKRERQMKKWSRAKKEALIAGDMQKLKSLSKCRNQKSGSGYAFAKRHFW